jgi:hypothetical protein
MPILTYAAETWTQTKAYASTLRAAEKGLLRSISRKPKQRE